MDSLHYFELYIFHSKLINNIIQNELFRYICGSKFYTWKKKNAHRFHHQTFNLKMNLNEFGKFLWKNLKARKKFLFIGRQILIFFIFICHGEPIFYFIYIYIYNLFRLIYYYFNGFFMENSRSQIMLYAW